MSGCGCGCGSSTNIVAGIIALFPTVTVVYFFTSESFRYVRLIFDDELEPKVVQQRAITAPELLTYFEVYVKMFQADSKSFPKVRPSFM